MADPIPIRLLCPSCGWLHIDEGEFATKPHHTHACQHCGHVWRPAVVPTVGVQFLPGFRNEQAHLRAEKTPAVEPTPPRPTPVTCNRCGAPASEHNKPGGDLVGCPDFQHFADPTPPEPAPVGMLLFCPHCGMQHIDAPEPDTGWTNPPHKSHKCHGCGCIWRPADVPTDGVVNIRTRGSADTWGATWVGRVAKAAPAPAPDAGNLHPAGRYPPCVVDALHAQLKAAEARAKAADGELSRCYKAILDSLGSVQVESIDEFLRRYLPDVRAQAEEDEKHHQEHHAREGKLKERIAELEAPQLARAIRAFVRLILHGDDEHQAWLLEAAERFLADESVPPPRPEPAPAPDAGELPPACIHCGELEIEHGYREGHRPPPCLRDKWTGLHFEPDERPVLRRRVAEQDARVDALRTQLEGMTERVTKLRDELAAVKQERKKCVEKHFERERDATRAAIALQEVMNALGPSMFEGESPADTVARLKAAAADLAIARESADLWRGNFLGTLEQLTAAEAALSLVKTSIHNVWRWQGDGYDEIDSLVCPVVMSADTCREIVGRREKAEAALEAMTKERDEWRRLCTARQRAQEQLATANADADNWRKRAEKAEAALEAAREVCEVAGRYRDIRPSVTSVHESIVCLGELRDAVDALRAAQGKEKHNANG